MKALLEAYLNVYIAKYVEVGNLFEVTTVGGAVFIISTQDLLAFLWEQINNPS